jgi:hypothetical protein
MNESTNMKVGREHKVALSSRETFVAALIKAIERDGQWFDICDERGIVLAYLANPAGSDLEPDIAMKRWVESTRYLFGSLRRFYRNVDDAEFLRQVGIKA